MEKDKEVGSKLSYCKMNRCSPDLQRLSEQVNVLPPKRLSKKLVLTQTYNYGAATVINKEARNLVCRCWPEIDNLPHDLWVGLICYWFGKYIMSMKNFIIGSDIRQVLLELERNGLE